jgi:hypothetical protein
MRHSRLSFISVVGLTLLVHSASAQLAATKPKDSPDNVAGMDKAVSKAEEDRIRKARRSQARSLLFSLGSDARGFRDQTLRARSLARIADALWGVAAEQARTLFHEAWEAAEIAERESQQRLDLRRQVLSLAARHDRLLAEEFLQKLKVELQETKDEPSENNLWGAEASEKRLTLAKELLSTGDIKRALQFADPVLGSANISTLEFLTQLRDKDPAAADQRYAVMLTNTGGNTLADANTISLLSSYIFTPHTYVYFDPEGSPSYSMMRSSFPPASVTPQLRLAFFQIAASVLLRPQPPAEQDQSTTGIAGKYMVLKRLMPLFEQYAPKEITDAMRGQFEGLNSLVSDGVRQSENEWIQKAIRPEKQLLADQEHSLLDQIERAKTAEERDELYFKLATLALSKDDIKARDYVSKIDASGFRKQAQAWVDWSLAIGAIEKKRIETALELARNGELTHIQRLWVLTQSAKLLAKTDRDKALSLLDDATAEAGRIEGIDLDRPRGLLAIANALKLIEPSRAWDAIMDAIKAANSTEGFTGEDGVITLHVNSKSQISKKTDAIPDFDIEGIFGKLANTDYDRAVQLARVFQGEAPRANATIAIARAVLNEKDTAAPAPPATKK